MQESEVPLAPRKARTDLITLLAQNAPEFVAPADERDLVFAGWRALCMHHAPVFVEKSPHHLHQWSCLALMMEAAALLPEIDFQFVGLVRNPMDMIYSAWSRWRLPPQRIQFEWLEAYQNLLRFKDLVGDRLTLVHYESLVTEESLARGLCDRLQIDGVSASGTGALHKGSMLKWKSDRSYGFQLDSKVAAVAVKFGYTPEQLSNHPSYRWKLHYSLTRAAKIAWFRPKEQLKKSLAPARALISHARITKAR